LGQRLDEWVAEHGGTEYVRQVVARAREVELERLAREARHRERQAFYETVLGAVCAAMADARNAHGDNLDGLETSVAKRLSGRLWNLLWPKSEEVGGAPFVCGRPSDGNL
jgi:hypothetical protein